MAMLRRVQAVSIYCLINDDVRKDYKSFDDWMTVNNEWMWKEAVVSYICLE
jgi:glutaredoxin-related protein